MLPTTSEKTKKLHIKTVHKPLFVNVEKKTFQYILKKKIFFFNFLISLNQKEYSHLSNFYTDKDISTHKKRNNIRRAYCVVISQF